jgi:hypothetical protein
MCLFLIGGLAAAQIVKPRVGYIVDRQGCLRGVDGIGGAFTVGEILEREVLSAAFSGRVLVVKHSDRIRINDTTLDAPAGPVTVVFGAKGHPTGIFFSEANVLWTWDGEKYSAASAYEILSAAYIRQGELIVNGVPVRVSAEATHVSQLGEGWLVVYAGDARYAVRGEQVFELPEGDAE